MVNLFLNTSILIILHRFFTIFIHCIIKNFYCYYLTWIDTVFIDSIIFHACNIKLASSEAEIQKLMSKSF